MKNLFKSERNSFVVAGIILFSIIMIATIPIALSNTSENINSESSGIGIIIAIIMHLVVLGIYLKVVWENKQNRNRDGGYIAVAIILTILGLIYMDGAVAFITDRETLFISILMF